MRAPQTPVEISQGPGLTGHANLKFNEQPLPVPNITYIKVRQ
jgi:hypothetical protein